ncbi:MAG: FadR/GntR family transcriptional regulator [Candidatus Promineifilaceae bacterium]|nr:FadR/GntR family transcriptional regulator [Candidatus Promineifilaceae bacterium]
MVHSIAKTSVTDETVEQIVQMIRHDEYAPGDRLPGERSLSKQLSVGRTSVREAIRRLETLGLLEVRQGLGTFVKDPGVRILQTSLAPHIVTDKRQLDELFETRKIIEIAAASLAAKRAGPSQVQAMQHWAQQVETYVARGDAQGLVTADVKFHRQIVAATGNSTLVALMDSIVDLLHDMRYDSGEIPQLLPEIVSGHRAIVSAIEQGDSEAAGQAMRAHLGTVAQRVMEYWQEELGSQTEYTAPQNHPPQSES